MALSRTFVGFSSTDIRYYWLMQAWKVNEHIDFNFTDCQLGSEINSENENYIKNKCRERINMAGKYVMLIGKDTTRRSASLGVVALGYKFAPQVKAAAGAWVLFNPCHTT